MHIPESMVKMLEQRKLVNSLRQLKTESGLIDFASNDYLGLASNQELAAIIRQKIFEGISEKSGATGSRLISGNHHQYEIVEHFFRQLFDAEGVLVFNSGYQANQAVVASIPQKGDTILYDQLAHVCLKEGAWLSKAQSFSFRHNDLDDLERRLKQASGQVFVVTETLFSMDGDLSPLLETITLCEQYGAFLIVDEAHSTGAYGKEGAGLLIEKGLHQRVFARIYTFGKAMGVHGACVAGSQQLVQYLVNFARPFIYTTGLPPHSLIAIHEAFKYLQLNPELQHNLINNIRFFKTKIGSSTNLLSSNSAIQPFMVFGNENCRQLAVEIQSAGLDVKPILAPTVPEGSERLRISIHANHTEQEINRLSEILNRKIAKDFIK